MTINGNRRFKGNDGKSYFVQNANVADLYKGRYILTVLENGFYKPCLDLITLDVLYFASIKDAQRKILYSADLVTTM